MEPGQSRQASEDSPLLSSVDETPEPDPSRLPTFTVRSIAIGLIIGVVVCLSNVYFGLQNGFADTMAMGSSLLGFALFRPLNPRLRVRFGPKENVFIQTVAGAVASMPMTAGLVSVFVALEHLMEPSEGGPLHFKWLDLAIWALGLCCSGAFFAMLLREHILKQQNMPFPSASATATIINALHGRKPMAFGGGSIETRSNCHATVALRNTDTVLERVPQLPPNSVWFMSLAFIASGMITVTESVLPILHNIPFLGNGIAQEWLWAFKLSPGIIGQGIITGPVIPTHMLTGTIVGWGILSPLAKKSGWVQGTAGDWAYGSRGWTLWIALSILLTDCLISLVWMILSIDTVRVNIQIAQDWARESYTRPMPNDHVEIQSSSPSSSAAYRPLVQMEQPKPIFLLAIRNRSPVPAYSALLISILASAAFCAGTTKFTFGEQIPIGAILLAVVISLFLGLVSIRAMGQTDHSPVSALGKLSQFVFALIISGSNPKRFIINLVAGAIGEAGAMQAAILMFDLKTGSLLGANPFAQMSGHILGSFFGAFISAGFYRLYTTIYAVPGPVFQAPTAYIWLAAARLAYGAGLPKYSLEFSAVFAIVFAITTTLKIVYHRSRWNKFIPGGVAFAIGMYNAPSLTLPRVLGGILYWICYTRLGVDPITLRLISAGLILGESILSLAGLLIPNNLNALSN